MEGQLMNVFNKIIENKEINNFLSLATILCGLNFSITSPIP